MTRLFGTDGVRGLANQEITAELALALGSAAATVLVEKTGRAGRRPRALIGRDPRVSGHFLSAALSAGMSSAGVDVTDVGVLPTPALAYLTSRENTDVGVMVSASHNAMPDNGIKFFARGGVKLENEVEDAIEVALSGQRRRPVGAEVGRIATDKGTALERYMEHVLSTIDVDLTGVRVAIDAANGAGSHVGPTVLREAGADVVVINAFPDGRNINEKCGSTHMEQLQAAVVAFDAHFGVALDGDADRCLAVDHTGAVVNGDKIMGVLATSHRDAGTLLGNTLVLTVMSNLGLLIALEEAGIRTIQADVGDRYVLEAMKAGGFNLGGEQSGHIIMGDHATTGDGVLTALHLAAEVAKSGKTLADLVAPFVELPQILINVSGVDKAASRTNEPLLAAVAAAQARLGATGRVLLRPSGTEPLVRVMVEAATAEQARTEAEGLADVVKAELSL